MLILHVPPPVVLSRERFTAALFRVRAASNCAMVLARLVVFVVDVAVQMRLGAEALVASRALVWPLVVALVVAVMG